jgi:galactose mutarotase-like enzyme
MSEILALDRYRSFEIGEQVGLHARVRAVGAFLESLRLGQTELLVPHHVNSSGSRRGGVPICAPIFGPGEAVDLPQHGYARDMSWGVRKKDQTGGLAQFSLEGHEPETPDLYAGVAMQASMRIFTKNKRSALHMGLHTQHNGNRGDVPYSPAMHPYFPATEEDEVKVVFPEDKRSETIDKAELGKGVEFKDFRPGSLVSFATPGHIVGIISPEATTYMVWSDNPDKYLCVEPTLNGAIPKTGVQSFLQPGQSASFNMQVAWVPIER